MAEPVWKDDPELAAAADRERAIYLADARPVEYSDESLALRFSAQHVDDARFVAAWGKWLLWSGARWHPDATLRVFDQARAICRAASGEISDDPKKQKLAAAIASAKSVAAVLSLARADRRHAVTFDQWDADPWLILTGESDVDSR